MNGKILRDESGQPMITPGSLKSVKAIGWFIKEYGIAQISMNLTNLNITPLHIAFDEVCRKADARGLRVTGSELVGLIPLKAMLDAGKFFLNKQQRSAGVSERELIRIAILSMGLNELGPFKPEERIIEYMLKNSDDEKLISHSLREFADETSSESPAPGGGSVAAYIGALSAGLGAMVANLTAQKKDWRLFGEWAEKASACKNELLLLVDADTKAFESIIEARNLPKTTEAEIAHRTKAMQAATVKAIDTPYRVMQVAFHSMEILEFVAREGNPNSKSDAGVGALCARSAVWGAWLNVCINATGSESDKHISTILSEGKKILSQTIKKEKEILDFIGLDA